MTLLGIVMRTYYKEWDNFISISETNEKFSRLVFSARPDDQNYLNSIILGIKDDKVVINQIVQSRFGQDDRDMNRLALRTGADKDVDAGAVGLGNDLDVLGRITLNAFAVQAEVERAAGLAADSGDGFEHMGNKRLIHQQFPLSLVMQE